MGAVPLFLPPTDKREYTGKPINGDKTAQDGMEQPVYFWTPDIAPAGIGFYTGKLFPAWQGDLFVCELVGKSLVRLVLKDERVIAEERPLTELEAESAASPKDPTARSTSSPIGTTPRSCGRCRRSNPDRGLL